MQMKRLGNELMNYAFLIVIGQLHEWQLEASGVYEVQFRGNRRTLRFKGLNN